MTHFRSFIATPWEQIKGNLWQWQGVQGQNQNIIAAQMRNLNMKIAEMNKIRGAVFEKTNPYIKTVTDLWKIQDFPAFVWQAFKSCFLKWLLECFDIKYKWILPSRFMRLSIEGAIQYLSVYLWIPQQYFQVLYVLEYLTLL